MKRRTFKVTLLIILGLVIVLNIPIIQVNHQSSENDYSNWMSENIVNDINIVDIKMIGAHDAYSSEINVLSQPDEYAGSVMKGIPGTLLKGFLTKQSVTQITDTKGLLKSGVRYLDIRLTYNDEKWTTKHNFTSSDFSMVAEDLLNFLSEYDGEFLILDFQHIDGLDYDDADDYQMFIDMLEEAGLLEYNYTDELKSLGEITYNEITFNKTKSSVIIIDKFTKEGKQTYQYDQAIRSSWANDDDFDDTIDFLLEEGNLIDNSSDYDNAFVVMQAVTTMQMSLPGMVNTLKTWSLLERAADFNNYLIEHEEFPTLLNSYQIIMIDYANCNDDDFLDNMMQLVINYNTEEG